MIWFQHSGFCSPRRWAEQGLDCGSINDNKGDKVDYQLDGVNSEYLANCFSDGPNRSKIDLLNIHQRQNASQ